MKSQLKLWIACFTVVTLAVPVVAIAAGSTSNSSGATVNPGLTSVEYRMGYSEDDKQASEDDRFRTRIHLDHAFNDDYAIRLIAAQDKRDGQNMEHQAFGMEHRFQLIERAQHGWDGGVRILYTHADGDKRPSTAGFNFVSNFYPTKATEFRYALVMLHDVGAGARPGLNLSLRTEFAYTLPHIPNGWADMDVGFEFFNTFGNLREQSGIDDQDHQLGPMFRARMENGFYSQVGYRHGLSSGAPKQIFKLSFGKQF